MPCPGRSVLPVNLPTSSTAGMWTLHKLRNGTIASDIPNAANFNKDRGDGAGDSRKGQLWEQFSPEEIERYPALKKRNFFCVQRHQATGMHCSATVHDAPKLSKSKMGRLCEAFLLIVNPSLRPSLSLDARVVAD